MEPAELIGGLDHEGHHGEQEGPTERGASQRQRHTLPLPPRSRQNQHEDQLQRDECQALAPPGQHQRRAPEEHRQTERGRRPPLGEWAARAARDEEDRQGDHEQDAYVERADG